MFFLILLPSLALNQNVGNLKYLVVFCSKLVVDIMYTVGTVEIPSGGGIVVVL